MKTIVHVNQHKIRENLKQGTANPVLTVKDYKSNRYATNAIIRDASGNEVARVVYSPNKPLSCGARVWIETELEVETK
tara:strand:- start:56 stop:289 length:234 start_codon:yes stop_codon:yes gene_type:complete